VFLVCEDPDHELVVRLARALRAPAAALGFDARVAALPRASLDADLARLYTAPRVVLSVSSFAWWPAFLSRRARAVVVPRWGLLRAHAWAPAPDRAPGRTLWHDLTLRAEGAGARVVEIDLAHLPCWAGNTRAAWDSLFD
jgi:hypothetical protein